MTAWPLVEGRAAGLAWSSSPGGMQPQSVIIHERLAEWSRQLRPRFRGSPIRWSETRSAAELAGACARSTCPILVLNLAQQPVRGLQDLDVALSRAPRALSLVLEPRSDPGVAMLARELGASRVLSGVVVPPEVVAILNRWLPLARRRIEAEGWSPGEEPDPWDRPDPIAAIEAWNAR